MRRLGERGASRPPLVRVRLTRVGCQPGNVQKLKKHNRQPQGGSKHDGIAGVLRLVAAAAPPSEGQADLLDVAFRRTAPSRTSSEAAAIALGMKRARRCIPRAQRQRVLILSDSECALDFFCGAARELRQGNAAATRGANRHSGTRRSAAATLRGRGRATESGARREEAHQRALYSLLADTPTEVLFAKVRSSSRGAGPGGADGGEDVSASNGTEWDGIGFVDHDAADHLSAIARSVTNHRADEAIAEVRSKFRAVPPLDQGNLDWLQTSEKDETREITNHYRTGAKKTGQAVGGEARDVRRRRSQRRADILREMLGTHASGIGIDPCAQAAAA